MIKSVINFLTKEYIEEEDFENAYKFLGYLSLVSFSIMILTIMS